MSHTYAACEKCGKINSLPLGKSGTPVCGGCKEVLAVHDGMVEVTERTLRALVDSSPIPVIVDFWAPWCGPCRAFAPVFQQTAASLAGKAVFAKANTEAYPAVSMGFHIRGIPTIAVLHKGKELQRVSGAMGQAEFEAWLAKYITK